MKIDSTDVLGFLLKGLIGLATATLISILIGALGGLL